MDDSNTNVGNGNHGFEDVIGRNDLEETSKNGEWTYELEHSGNTFHSYKRAHTWLSPDRKS